jgi:hypothetical protein
VTSSFQHPARSAGSAEGLVAHLADLEERLADRLRHEEAHLLRELLPELLGGLFRKRRRLPRLPVLECLLPDAVELVDALVEPLLARAVERFIDHLPADAGVLDGLRRLAAVAGILHLCQDVGDQHRRRDHAVEQDVHLRGGVPLDAVRTASYSIENAWGGADRCAAKNARRLRCVSLRL